MENLISNNKAWIDETWQKIDNKLSKVAERSYDKLPYTTDANGVHDDKALTDVGWWTNGFWGGMLWIMYLDTQNEVYKKSAIRSEKKLNETFKNYKRLDHDAGFMWHLTSGANYRITGDEIAFSTNMLAAASLASRYNIEGKYIRAWNGESVRKLSIIDCMMNLCLLYWASESIGDDRFKKIAMAHADMSLRDHIRPDGTVNHQVEHDETTGEATAVYAGQGSGDNSCWTRGLAWAVYGSMISYKHTGEQRYLDAAIKTANYFIVNSLRTDYLAPIDFRSPIEPQYYDSTASACTACALLEIAKYVTEAEAYAYTDAAIKMLKAIDEKCCNYDENVDYLVGMGSERYPHEPDQPYVHIPIIYGDFFYVEALSKLRGLDFFIW